MNKLVTVKLDDSNYLIWKHQVLTAIRGYGLEDYLTGSSAVPTQFINGESGEILHNPEYVTQQRQYQLLTSWRLSSINPDLLPQFLVYESAHSIWMAISQLFAAQSSARVMRLKFQLQTLKKGSLSMKDYLLKMKSICDTLAACGCPVSDEDQILPILAALGSEFEPTIAVLTSQIQSYNLQTATPLLLTSESRAIQQTSIPESPMFANIAMHVKRPWNTNSRNHFSHRHNCSSYKQNNYSNHGRGRGRMSHNKNICQLCGKTGHIVESVIIE